jgi:predicted NAD/FAD-binding protein
VAVVGAGVAGLTAGYLLARRHEVVLFEADDRLGGHAHTHDVRIADGRTIGVDSGFIVHNAHTYPNLLRLFGDLGAPAQDPEMSMSVRCEGCGLEYAGARGPAGLPSGAICPAGPRPHARRGDPVPPGTPGGCWPTWRTPRPVSAATT